MKDLVFTSYAFGGLYCFQQERLKKSILKIYPEAELRFWHSEDTSSIDIGRPPGARTFSESMYGFKPHCVLNCLREGFRRVVFLDVAIVLEDRIDDVLERARDIGVLATEENTDLHTVISDECLEYEGLSREDLKCKALTLVGGSVYIFDFTHPATGRVFGRWLQMEQDGMFGSEDKDCRGELQGHRKDETCMSLCLSRYGIKPQSFDAVGYHNLGGGNANRKFTFYKLHFKGISEVHGHSVNQTLIPLHGNILDLGCRGFEFTNFWRDLEYRVYSIDIGEFPGVYYRIAVGAESGKCGVEVNERDPDATRVVDGDEIPMCTIDQLTSHFGVEKWHLIKMDIEGSELEILKKANHPIADQVSVEFHIHTGAHTKEEVDQLIAEMEQYYHVVNLIYEERHSAGLNYWDVLFISKNGDMV